MAAEFQFFSKNQSPFGINSTTECLEDRHRSTQLEVIVGKCTSSSGIIDCFGSVCHKISGNFIDIFCSDTCNLFCPFRRIFIIKYTFLILFKSIEMFSNIRFVIKLFCQYNISQCQYKCQIRSRIDRQPLIRFGCCIGKSRIDTDQFRSSALGPLESIHRIRCYDRFCSVGACHNDILCIF